MVRFTFLGRVSDALPLTMSLDKNDEQLAEYQRQAKLVLRRMMPNMVREPISSRGAIKTGPFVFYYLVDMGVCFMVLCDKAYARLLAFSMLFEIQKEFFENFSATDVQSAQRPYALIHFEPFLDKTKRRYLNTRSLRTPHNLAELSDRLQQVPHYDIRDVIGSDFHEPAEIAQLDPLSADNSTDASHREWSCVAFSFLSLLLALVWLYERLVMVSVFLSLQPKAAYSATIYHTMTYKSLGYLHILFSLVLVVESISVLRRSLLAIRAAPVLAFASLVLAGVQLFISLGSDKFNFLWTHAIPSVVAVALCAAALRLRSDLRAAKANQTRTDHLD